MCIRNCLFKTTHITYVPGGAVTRLKQGWSSIIVFWIEIDRIQKEVFALIRSNSLKANIRK